eukprot:Nk52_evm8s310 gene=Nk52_evmTU8s310
MRRRKNGRAGGGGGGLKMRYGGFKPPRVKSPSSAETKCEALVAREGNQTSAIDVNPHTVGNVTTLDFAKDADGHSRAIDAICSSAILEDSKENNINESVSSSTSSGHQSETTKRDGPDLKGASYSCVLTDEQDAAVHCSWDGSVAIVAGPGTGKTHTLVHRVRYLLEWLQPEEIVMVTFTKKAALEMQTRLETLLGDKKILAKRVYSGTFHGLLNRGLRSHGSAIGLKKNFTIMDQEDTVQVLKDLLNTSLRAERMEGNRALRDRIMNAMKKDFFASSLNSKYVPSYQKSADGPVIRKYVNHVRELYEDYKLRKNVLSFSDVLVCGKQLLQKSSFLENVKHVLVDEFQDVNELQYEIVNLLARCGNITIVGDPDQSIYGFRHSDPSFMLNFDKDYPQAKILRLEKSHRSGQQIIGVVNSVIKTNNLDFKCELKSTLSHSVPVHLLDGGASFTSEASRITNTIMQYRKAGGNFKDCAILLRTKRPFREFEIKFLLAKIPYVLRGGESFFQKKEIKDVTCYLRLAMNEDDDIAFQRVYNVPTRGCGTQKFNVLKSVAESQCASLMGCLNKKGVPTDILTSFKSFIATIEKVKQMIKTRESLQEAIAFIIESTNYEEHLNKMYKNDQAGLLSKKESLDSFATLASQIDFEQYETPQEAVSDFIASVVLDGDKSTFRGVNKKEGSVTISTMHSAKGLEWPLVFVAGTTEGTIPSIRAETIPDVEEERRIFYVALTRAEKFLIISYHGPTPSYFTKPFLSKLRKIENYDDQHNIFEPFSTNFKTSPKQKPSQPN